MGLNISTLPNYERYNPFQKLDPGGPHENVGVLHLGETVASLARFRNGPVPTPGTDVSINPQPLPPGQMVQSSWLTPGALVSLNPQPLPPEPPPTQDLWNTSAVLFGRGSEVGILPPHYHGPTPDPAPWAAVGAWLR